MASPRYGKCKAWMDDILKNAKSKMVNFFDLKTESSLFD